MSDYTLHLGDWREIIDSVPKSAAVIADPPYGMDLDTDHSTQQRSRLAQSNDFAPIIGDNQPFDPTPFLSFKKVVMFGANWFADKLPITGAWVVWDKLDGLESKRELGFNDNSDCELIWTNQGNVARIIRHRWMGMLKASENTESRVHPTQKPVALMRKIIRNYTNPGDLIFDPFMGSGTTAIACIETNRRFIGCEIDPSYHAIAVERCARAAERLNGFQALRTSPAEARGLFAESEAG